MPAIIVTTSPYSRTKSFLAVRTFDTRRNLVNTYSVDDFILVSFSYSPIYCFWVFRTPDFLSLWLFHDDK